MLRLLPALLPTLLSLSILAGALPAASLQAASAQGRPLLDALASTVGAVIGGPGISTGTGTATSPDTATGTGTPPETDTSTYPGGVPDAQTAVGPLPNLPATNEEMRGLWVASVLNLDWPHLATPMADTLKEDALSTLDFAQKHRFNAIFLQVRPTADALYPSELFPWSQYLTGTAGTPPTDGFDPLAFWVAEAHKRGLELHAWINPYRITKKPTEDPPVTLDMLPATSPARQHPEWTVLHTDGNLYFNPGLPEVRQFLLTGIREIIDDYAVDGIHFDDYFYPDGSATKASAAPIAADAKKRGFTADAAGVLTYASPFNDSEAFLQYGAAHATIDDWRRANVDAFVRDVSLLTRQASPAIRFGISPFGIWRNQSSDAEGSATNGSESYTAHAADSRKWVRMGWVDYIAPQLYWPVGFAIADYDVLSAWWCETVRGTGVDLYLGQAIYRMDADDVDSAWYGVAEYEKQEVRNRADSACDGTIVFSSQSLRDKPGLAAALLALREAEDGLTTGPGGGYRDMLEATNAPDGTPPANATEAAQQATGTGSGGLLVSRPSASFRTNAANQYLNGASNPNKPLYLNGSLVENRSPDGYFGIYVPLAYGKNTLVLSQEGIHVIRTVWRNKPQAASAPEKMTTVGIPAASAYPQSPLYGQPGETYVLSCTAPIGAKVTVKVGGVTYAMTPASTTPPGTGAYPTTYRLSWVMPKQTGSPRVVDAGAPLYTMTWGGKTYTRSAPAKIGIVMKGAPFYAEVLKEASESYDGMTTSGGTRYYLDKNGRDTVTGMVGDWVRLGSGLFVRKNTVKVAKAPSVIQAKTTHAVYTGGTAADSFSFDLSSPTLVTAHFDGTALRIRVPLATTLALPVLPEGGLFASVTTETSGSGQAYVFHLRESVRLDGYALERTTTGYVMPLKRHIPGNSDTQPLLGKTILLDPGHGGTKDTYADGDPGAIGPLGTLWSERSINLAHARVLQTELERLGANVVLTRSEDTPLSLEARLSASRELQPDLFLSLHADSLDDTADISKVSGFSVWYREPLAADVGTRVLRKVVDTMGLKDRRLNQRNFYVVRGTWTPSILLEAGFVPNTAEFEQMLDPAHQKKMMGLVAEAIGDYFRQ